MTHRHSAFCPAPPLRAADHRSGEPARILNPDKLSKTDPDGTLARHLSLILRDTVANAGTLCEAIRSPPCPARVYVATAR